jgi:hypothetical protein
VFSFGRRLSSSRPMSCRRLVHAEHAAQRRPLRQTRPAAA